MKLSIREDSTNYACTVIKLPVKQKVEGLDNLVRVNVFGNDCLVGKDEDEDILYLFFPAECQIDEIFLSSNNLYRNTNMNKDQTKKGFFEDSGRVKAIKFKGVISTGFVVPITTLDNHPELYSEDLKVGDEFTDIGDFNICKKYKPVRMQSTTTKESRHNKKLKRFDRLVANQFRFHGDTSHLARNLHQFEPDQIICITDKWHGTSTIHSNLLINVELNMFKRIVLYLASKLLGNRINLWKYDNIYASRSVVKNQYINKEVGPGYYNEDIWGIVNKELDGKIEQGITLYGEIVGHLPSGKAIQKGYDYLKGCPMKFDPLIGKDVVQTSHRFLVYRVTYTKPNGEVIEFSWQQIVEYCKKYSIEHVKVIFFGKAIWFYSLADGDGVDLWRQGFLDFLQRWYLEKDCPHCVNKVPAEGICVRIDGKPTYSTFKLKSKRFLEKETKALDAGEMSMEDLTDQEEYINEPPDA